MFATTVPGRRTRLVSDWYSSLLGVAALFFLQLAVCAATAHAEPAHVFASGGARAGVSVCYPDWRRWRFFKNKFISKDGRVIDLGSRDARTVSEGQAYALFFALAANDRREFDLLLDTTQNILAQGDLTKHLPAWLWGKRKDGTWGVIDDNPASDADLWLAYTLLQAGRVWNVRRYRALGTVVARQVLRRETAYLPGLGLSLLPGPTGFHPSDNSWRLNPSYMPLQVLRGMGAALPHEPEWKNLADSSLNILVGSAPQGYSPDWVMYEKRGKSHRFSADTATHGAGSYNAIRVYLWAGMLSPEDPDFDVLHKTFRPMADYVRRNGYPPESVSAVTGKAKSNAGNAGFSAALVPFLRSSGQAGLASLQIARVQNLESESALGYYSQVLALFALGWNDGRFRFAEDGRLSLAWQGHCKKAHP
jgi:endoglucanase